jgi:hypothetical protein
MVFEALVLSRLMYASQTWGGGGLSQELVGRIDAFLRRIYRHGLCQKYCCFTELSDLRNLALFNSVTKSNNCINCLLSPVKTNAVSRRPRGHNFSLPKCDYNLYRSSFLIGCLYKFV